MCTRRVVQYLVTKTDDTGQSRLGWVHPMKTGKPRKETDRRRRGETDQRLKTSTQWRGLEKSGFVEGMLLSLMDEILRYVNGGDNSPGTRVLRQSKAIRGRTGTATISECALDGWLKVIGWG